MHGSAVNPKTNCNDRFLAINGYITINESINNSNICPQLDANVQHTRAKERDFYVRYKLLENNKLYYLEDTATSKESRIIKQT
jgi:hypothetical protein